MNANIINAYELNLGYRFTFNNDTLSIALTKDSGTYFIKGFNLNKYINLSFTTLAPAKKEFNKLIKSVQK